MACRLNKVYSSTSCKGKRMLTTRRTATQLALFVGGLGMAGSASAGDLAESMCSAYMPVLENAQSFRSQGLPISATKDMASSAFDVDVNLYAFLISAIEWTYVDPDGANDALRNGKMLETCTTTVRGF